MKFVLKINGSESKNAAFIGWTPVKCTLTIDEYTGESTTPVIITANHAGLEGRIALYKDNKITSQAVDNIKHDFHTAPELTFYVAGVFGCASIGKKDTYIKVAVENPAENNIETLRRDVMVRVRKNANTLTQDEIRMFLETFVSLELESTPREYNGNFSKTPSKLLHEIVLMHTFEAAYEIHNRESFHPWHRAYLMHLERELQSKNPHVTVPYWKFDEPAANVFTPDFLGKTNKSEDSDLDLESLRPEFNDGNPLNYYKEYTVWGPLRRAYRYNDPAKEKSNPSIQNESTILQFSDDFKEWCNFEERRSHNQAHNAFTGHVVDIGKDPVDPLFFMMHANVDRLWAKWQERYNRYDSADVKTYPLQGSYQGPRDTEWRDKNQQKFNFEDGFFVVRSEDLGNFVDDKLWPWDKDQRLSRPWRKWFNSDYGCGNVPFLEIDFPDSETSNLPTNNVTVKSTIDYQGRIDNEIFLGFDYDDIPYFEKDKKPVVEELINTVEYNKTFLDKEIEESTRLQAADLAILHSSSDQEKALNILADKNGETLAIRLKAVKLIDESRNSRNEEEEKSKPWFLKIAIPIISDESEPVELRSELIHKMLLARRSNRRFHSRKPEFLNILRGLLNSEHEILKKQAFEILSSFGDHKVQEMLVQEIEDPNNQLLTKSSAVFLLRQSAKNEHVKLFQNLVNSDQSTEVKQAAIKGLGTHQDSRGFLENLITDRLQTSALRKATIQPLFHLQKERLLDMAPKILLESQEDEGIVLFSADEPEPTEVEFKTQLLGVLSLSSDLNQLKENDDLINALKQLRNSDTTEKFKFRSTAEKSNQQTIGSPTIIEQMAAKLLNRLEEISNE